MKKQFPVWQRVIFFLLLGRMTFAIPYALPSAFGVGPFPLLGLFFIVEALAQPNPSEQKTPLYQFVGKYPNRRDKIVAGISFAVLIVALYLPDILLHDIIQNSSWLVTLLIAVLSLLFAVGLYFAVALYFGSPELREIIVPKMLKKFWKKQNSA